MSCCDTGEGVHATNGVCGGCSTKGAPVASITVKALLTPDGLRKGIPQAPRFCATPSCRVVYFDDVSHRRVEEGELLTLVFAKHRDDPATTVCYCFGFTVGDIRALRSRKASLVSETVRHEVEAGHCACEVKNPKGTCCLGDLLNVERRTE